MARSVHGPARCGLGPPLRGPRWAVIVEAHRRALQPINGALQNSQRFVTDWSARLDAQGRTGAGDLTQNTSYFAYRQPVLAVGGGEVVEAVDRYPDQIPNQKVPVGLDAADGNYVILKLGEGVFAGYAHFKPGSVRVHRGQRVRSGQVLGELGNSGNTTGPHLHFQLMNRPSLLDADGLPFVLNRFTLEGRVPSQEALAEADMSGTPVPVSRSAAAKRRQGLIDLDVVTLQGG
jgi:murein DD-endopeptidase MepM/ murein hydrolase activator NlpD